MKSKLPNIQDCISFYCEIESKHQGVDYSCTSRTLRKGDVSPFIDYDFTHPKKIYVFTPTGEKESYSKSIYHSMKWLRNFYRKNCTIYDRKDENDEN